MRRGSEPERASGQPRVEKVGLVTARSNNWGILPGLCQAGEASFLHEGPRLQGLGPSSPSSRPTASNYRVLDLDPFRRSSRVALASRMLVSVKCKWGHGDAKVNPQGHGVSSPGPLKARVPTGSSAEKETRLGPGPGPVLGATRTKGRKVMKQTFSVGRFFPGCWLRPK